jgi:ribA/ribD-fused uncharacterized protein
MGDPNTIVKCVMHDAECQTSSEMDNSVKKHCFRSCTVLCKFDGGNPKPRRTTCEWVRCSICMHWFHPECVSLPLDESEGFWTCPTCRNVPEDVTDLKDTVSNLQMTIQTLLEIVKRNNATISQLAADQRDNLCGIRKIQATIDDRFPQAPPVPAKSLLIGDSLIKHVKAKNDNLIVVSNIPKISNVLNELANYSDLNSAYLVIGTNDCKGKADPVEIIQNFKLLLNEVKKKAEKVYLSSITPRTDDAEVQQKINTVNQMLVTLTNEEKVHFLNNDENFLYRNNAVDNSLLLLDGCHLSHQGVLRLMGNLGLQDLMCSTLAPPKNAAKVMTPEPWNKVAGNSNKTSEIAVSNTDQNVARATLPPPAPPAPTPPTTKRRIAFHGHQHPLSNFFPCDIEIYDKCFANSESAYQYRKALEYAEWEVAAEIAQCTRAIDAKRLGDKITTNEHWWGMRESVMVEILNEKAKQCPEFRNTLLASDGNSLVEDTTHEFWGRGKHGKGHNKLGVLLEILRTNIPTSSQIYGKNNQSRRSKQYRGKGPNPSYDPGCGFCGERGHSSDVCGHGRPIKCRHCDSFGHKQKRCWFKSH